MSENNDIRSLLKDMAKLTVSTNTFTPVQEKNLKLFPLIFFNGVKSATVEFDLSTDSTVDVIEDKEKFDLKFEFVKPNTDHFKIKYNLEIDESQDNSPLDKRFEALEKAISTLLWGGIPLEVLFNNKSVYKSNTNGK